MRRQPITMVLLLTAVLAMLYASRQVGCAPESSNSEKAIIDLAVKTLGLDKSSAEVASIHRPITAEEVGFPDQVRDTSANGHIVCVDFDRVDVWHTAQAFEIAAFIDLERETLLKAILEPADSSRVAPAPLTPEDRKMFMRGWCFKGFPDSQYVPLLGVLRACPMGPMKAKRIVVLYVLDSCVASSASKGSTAPRWVTVLTEHPSYPSKGIWQVPDSVLDKGPTSAIIVQDGRTGEPQTAMTF